MGVHIITNKAIELNGITIVGLGSLWANDNDMHILDKYQERDHVLVLTHNPDTTLAYLPQHSPDLTLAGHTHGGQIRIPYRYKQVIPVEGDVLWDQGIYDLENNKVFVSSGIGEVGLPMRLFIPPAIDILTLY